MSVGTQLELGRRYSVPIVRLQMVKDRTLRHYARAIQGAKDAAGLLREFLDGADREHFVVITLDVRHKVTGLHVVSIGGLASAPVHPREVFKVALLANAAAIIIGHNHPSGHPEASRDDIMVTEQLRAAGRLLGVEVLDHIIVGEDGAYISLRETGQGFGPVA